VESEVGKGTEFIVVLPKQQSAANTSEETPAVVENAKHQGVD